MTANEATLRNFAERVVENLTTTARRQGITLRSKLVRVPHDGPIESFICDCGGVTLEIGTIEEIQIAYPGGYKSFELLDYPKNAPYEDRVSRMTTDAIATFLAYYTHPEWHGSVPVRIWRWFCARLRKPRSDRSG